MIEIRQADKSNFRPDSLDSFDRTQNVTYVYRPADGGGLKLVYQPFTETWSPERRREKAAEILSGKYITLCAFDGEKAAGAILLNPVLNSGRMIAESFHVSREYRRQGIGRMLTEAAKAEALRRGAHALYFSACSAKETIDFYTAMGCRPSAEPIASYAEEEPCDIQMELALRQDAR